jgi:hypothetical protein
MNVLDDRVLRGLWATPAPLIAGTHALPDQPQSQLNLTRRCRSRRDDAGGSQMGLFGVVQHMVGGRRFEIYSVREIEYLGVELQPRGLGNEPHGNISIHGVIQFSESRTEERVAAGIPQQVGRDGEAVARQVDVVWRVAWICEMCTGGADHTVRNVICAW